MPKATIFNSSFQSISVSVNHGQQVSIAEGNQEKPNFNILDFNMQPSPGSFGYGNNFIALILLGSEPKNLMIDIPMNDHIHSLQIYIFFNERQIVWTALNNGRLLNSGVYGQ